MSLVPYLLVYCLLLLSSSIITGESIIMDATKWRETEEDILFPKEVLQTDKHRYVRDCKPILNGTLNHVSIQGSNHSEQTYEVKYLSYNFSKKGVQYGHHTIVRNPAKMLSVLEPGRPGGCSKQNTSSVLDTATVSRCDVAINAGFFYPFRNGKDYGKCYGNVVSNGRYVQISSGIQNANFGIRENGMIVIGYFSREEVTSTENPFIQLISGVGWVIRDGKSFLNESIKAECKDTQTTGTLDYFFRVQAARTLLGFDRNGFVHLIQFDGKTGTKGINFYDAVEYLQAADVTNAINLDGGGSATYVVGSQVVNYPSDICSKKNGIMYNCARPVSTIVCVKKGKKLYSHIKKDCHCDETILANLSGRKGESPPTHTIFSAMNNRRNLISSIRYIGCEYPRKY